VRVEWVHPSWRDLVIEHLAADDQAREHFLRRCSVHGGLLALSTAGGQTGERRFPLLRCDADWDALTDRLYALVPELEDGELVGLLDALTVAARELLNSPSGPELDALARAVLARMTQQWSAQRTAIPLPALEAWIALARVLPRKPPSPAIGITWTELLPTATPKLSDRSSIERFADWLTLAALLRSYDPQLLARLSFPGRSRRYIDDLLDALERNPELADAILDHTVRALQRTASLITELTLRANNIQCRLAGVRELEDRPFPASPAGEQRPETSGHLDVERVLSDL
jgi:hypothetical protein